MKDTEGNSLSKGPNRFGLDEPQAILTAAREELQEKVCPKSGMVAQSVITALWETEAGGSQI